MTEETLDGRDPSEFAVYRAESGGGDHWPQGAAGEHGCTSFAELRKLLREKTDEHESEHVFFMARDRVGEDATVVYAAAKN